MPSPSAAPPPASPLAAPLAPLLREFDRLRAGHDSLVLATLLTTAGSTYQKAGARMLFAPDGQRVGLLSGGCLEHDLAVHAARVLDSGVAEVVSYDLRDPDDQLFGLGAGCEGALEVLLQRIDAAHDWAPLAALGDRVRTGGRTALAIACDGGALGTTVFAGDAGIDATLATALSSTVADGQPRTLTIAGQGWCVVAVPPTPRVLILGAGPDVPPLARLCNELGCEVTVFDHRPAYADAALFPGCAVHCAAASQLAATVTLPAFDAAIVMSHSLTADLAYLRALAGSGPDYVGLLGPAARRQKLLADLGSAARGLDGRLRAPVGLDIGARTPAAIALSIAAELHAVLSGREGRAFSAAAGD